MLGSVLKSARKCHKFAFITFFAGCIQFIQLTSTIFAQINGRVDYGDMTVELAMKLAVHWFISERAMGVSERTARIHTSTESKQTGLKRL